MPAPTKPRQPYYEMNRMLQTHAPLTADTQEASTTGTPGPRNTGPAYTPRCLATTNLPLRLAPFGRDCRSLRACAYRACLLQTRTQIGYANWEQTHSQETVLNLFWKGLCQRLRNMANLIRQGTGCPDTGAEETTELSQS